MSYRRIDGTPKEVQPKEELPEEGHLSEGCNNLLLVYKYWILVIGNETFHFPLGEVEHRIQFSGLRKIES